MGGVRRVVEQWSSGAVVGWVEVTWSRGKESTRWSQDACRRTAAAADVPRTV